MERSYNVSAERWAYTVVLAVLVADNIKMPSTIIVWAYASPLYWAAARTGRGRIEVINHSAIQPLAKEKKQKQKDRSD